MNEVKISENILNGDIQIFNMDFKKYIPTNIQSTIINSIENNIELSDVIRIPLTKKTEGKIASSGKSFSITTRGINDARNILLKNHNKKVVIVGEEPIEELVKKINQEMEDTENVGAFTGIYINQTYPNFRYLSYSDIENGKTITNLYTEHDSIKRRDIFDVLTASRYNVPLTIKFFLKFLTSTFPKDFSFDYNFNNKELNSYFYPFYVGFKEHNPGFVNTPKELLKFMGYIRNNLLTKADDEKIFGILQKYGLAVDGKILLPIEDQKLELAYCDVKKIYSSLFFSSNDLMKYCKAPNHNPEKIMRDIKGVYCDIDGTLILGEKDVNKKVVEKLIDMHNNGYKIHLWTAGVIDNKEKLLQNKLDDLIKFGLNKELLESMGLIKYDNNGNVIFNLLNKYDFAYCCPEYAIDDRVHNRFMLQMQIKPQHFINVDDLK